MKSKDIYYRIQLPMPKIFAFFYLASSTSDFLNLMLEQKFQYFLSIYRRGCFHQNKTCPTNTKLLILDISLCEFQILISFTDEINRIFGQNQNFGFKTGFVGPMFAEGNFLRVREDYILLYQSIANHLINLILFICASNTGKYRKRHTDTKSIVRASSLRKIPMEISTY